MSKRSCVRAFKSLSNLSKLVISSCACREQDKNTKSIKALRYNGLALVLSFHQTDTAVLSTQLGLFDLSGGITGNIGEDQLAGALIAG